MPFDLFLGVPKHRIPAVVEESGMAVDGWVPVDPITLQTRFPDVYAVGDVNSVGTPKAGVFSEGQAAVVAAQIVSRARTEAGAGPAATGAGYDGRGTCYLEFGANEVGRVTVTFLSGQPPVGDLEGPSQTIAEDKAAFGTTRVQRWFDRTWDHGARTNGLTAAWSPAHSVPLFRPAGQLDLQVEQRDVLLDPVEVPLLHAS